VISWSLAISILGKEYTLRGYCSLLLVIMYDMLFRYLLCILENDILLYLQSGLDANLNMKLIVVLKNMQDLYFVESSAHPDRDCQDVMK
jgi:hypothetical protein